MQIPGFVTLINLCLAMTSDDTHCLETGIGNASILAVLLTSEEIGHFAIISVALHASLCCQAHYGLILQLFAAHTALRCSIPLEMSQRL